MNTKLFPNSQLVRSVLAPSANPCNWIRALVVSIIYPCSVTAIPHFLQQKETSSSVRIDAPRSYRFSTRFLKQSPIYYSKHFCLLSCFLKKLRIPRDDAVMSGISAPPRRVPWQMWREDGGTCLVNTNSLWHFPELPSFGYISQMFVHKVG